MSFEVATATATAFPMFLPNVSAVRHYSATDPSAVSDVRIGEGFALAYSFSIAAYFSTKNDSLEPIAVWAVIVILFLIFYEAALVSEEGENGDAQ